MATIFGVFLKKTRKEAQSFIIKFKDRIVQKRAQINKITEKHLTAKLHDQPPDSKTRGRESTKHTQKKKMSHKKASGNDGFNNKKLLIDLSKVGGSNSGTNLKDKKDKREHSNNSDLTRDGKFWGISGPRPDYNELDENTSTEGHIQPITFEQCT